MNHYPHFSHKRAFTLLELLVVIAIIGIMATAGAVSLGSGSQSLQGASSIVSSIFGQARTEAIMRGTPVRVIVDTVYNSSRPDNYRRRVALVASADGGSTWQQIGRWTLIPGQAFFNAEMSRPNGTMSLAGLPGAGSGTYGYYEFLPNGQAASRGQVVLSAGTVVAGNFQERSPGSRSGFFIHKLGKPTFFADPASIPAP